MTAYATIEDQRKAFLAGFQSHISKPIEPTEVVAAIANLAQKVNVRPSCS
ncbi:hypothetical protein [Iningainema tapete]|uniref:Response regulatory domain-containing protein n=1 Tax=Iningainema tapete BLCC-T55 TaxID=2748662 RepID=A0A8J6XS05_9CYAN|nr:hypothetical protein [Iningainema tapete]MBD2775522.1 hypothetical protein [Iningainema tapete BLCC-T55]